MVKINPTFGKPMMGLTGTQFLGKNTASGEAEADKAICEHRKELGTWGGGHQAVQSEITSNWQLSCTQY